MKKLIGLLLGILLIMLVGCSTAPKLENATRVVHIPFEDTTYARSLLVIQVSIDDQESLDIMRSVINSTQWGSKWCSLNYCFTASDNLISAYYFYNFDYMEYNDDTIIITNLKGGYIRIDGLSMYGYYVKEYFYDYTQHN